MARPLQALAGAAIAAILAIGQAHAADIDLFSSKAFSGLIDLRVAGADGPESFLHKGYGRTRFGGDADGDFKGHVALADAAIVWQPQFTWALSGVLDAEYQAGQQHAIDVVQAYLAFKPTPKGAFRYSLKAGLFYPPISEEHEGPAWSVADTITPSAINTWVGEEVKVIGGEAKLTAELGGHELSATGGAFGYNDTSGALLAFRGWGLHDVKATAFGNFRLPPLDPYMAGLQPQFTSSTIEMDGNVGLYGRVDWRPPGRAGFSAFYYDNRGDKISLNHQLQWSWATRFWNFGATWDVTDQTRILSQVMTGEALMGYPNGRSVWINIGYTSAYLLATHSLGKSALTGRVEYFTTSDRNFRPATDHPEDDRGEVGWALTGAYRYQVSSHARLMMEVLHVDSNRPSLREGGLPPKQRHTVIQSSFRLTF